LLDDFGKKAEIADKARVPVADDARVPVLDNASAWERLPEAEEGAGSSLPVWARALVHSLPRTTAAMLELDWLHRANSPIEPKLRGLMRWTIAHANRCDYSKAYAEADLLRAGLEQKDIDALADGGSTRPEIERAAIDFTRKLTISADTITDNDVAQLITWYGDKQVVAMVLLAAHANFQDRLFLSLGLQVERGGPLPPVNVQFAKDSASKSVNVPERKSPTVAASVGEVEEATRINDVDWQSVDYSTLLNKLDDQRDRPGRIRVPTWDEVKELLPERARRNDPLRIKWSLVCVGYQPELAKAWSACTRAFAEESKQDRVFEESMFWVITRTIDCFY
jgi:alkylhydroperoxidase family enzyme